MEESKLKYGTKFTNWWKQGDQNCN